MDITLRNSWRNLLTTKILPQIISKYCSLFLKCHILNCLKHIQLEFIQKM